MAVRFCFCFMVSRHW